MKRRNQTITTYISTLTFHNTAPKQYHVYPLTTHNGDDPQPYRQAQRSSGTYYQLTKSSLPNSNKEQPELQQEVSENYEFPSAIHKYSPQQWRSSNNKIGTPQVGVSQTTHSSKEQPEPTTYTASFQGIQPHTTPYTLKPIMLSKSYEFPSTILQDSSSDLEHLPYTAVSQRAIHKYSPQQWRSSNNKNGAPQTTISSTEQPEQHQEASENASFRRSKTYIEELSRGSPSSSVSKSFTQYDQSQKKPKGSTAVSKEITSSITTTTSEEKKTLSGVKTEIKSTKPATDYGETDWYLDLLLRMQALEMEQQNLHAQYDFLGKLANENQENLKQARDWARYDADNYQVEAY